MKSNLFILMIFSILILACGRGSHNPVGLNQKLTPPSSLQNKTSQISFADVKPIFSKTCNLCHNPTSGLPDWMNYETSFAKKDRLYDRVVVKKDMPMGSKLSAEEIKLIAAWIDGGALPEVTTPIESNPEATPSPVENIPSPEVTPTPIETPIVNPAPNPVVGWDTEAPQLKKIIEAKCSLCHNPTSGLPNWSDYNLFIYSLDKIYDRVIVKKDMPLGIEMDEIDRGEIKLWIETYQKGK